MKTYEISMTAFVTVVVDCEDHETEQDAIGFARGGISHGDFNLDETSCVELKPDQVASHKRHADRVLEP